MDPGFQQSLQYSDGWAQLPKTYRAESWDPSHTATAVDLQRLLAQLPQGAQPPTSRYQSLNGVHSGPSGNDPVCTPLLEAPLSQASLQALLRGQQEDHRLHLTPRTTHDATAWAGQEGIRSRSWHPAPSGSVGVDGAVHHGRHEQFGAHASRLCSPRSVVQSAVCLPHRQVGPGTEVLGSLTASMPYPTPRQEQQQQHLQQQRRQQHEQEQYSLLLAKLTQLQASTRAHQPQPQPCQPLERSVQQQAPVLQRRGSLQHQLGLTSPRQPRAPAQPNHHAGHRSHPQTPRQGPAPLITRAPSWADPNWHPMRAVVAAGDLGSGGTGVFIPAAAPVAAASSGVSPRLAGCCSDDSASDSSSDRASTEVERYAGLDLEVAVSSSGSLCAARRISDEGGSAVSMDQPSLVSTSSIETLPDEWIY